MTVFRRLTLIVSLALVLAGAIAPNYGCASETRPNALDRRVDALTPAQLEHLPATKLVDRDRQLAAQRLARWMVPGWLGTIVFQIVALAYFWQSGTAARLRDLLRKRLRNEFLVRFVFGAALVLIARLAALIPSFYIFRVGRVMGISGLLLHTWGATWLLNTIVSMIIAGLVVAFVLWLVDRTHQWYIYTMLAIVAGSFLVAYIQPFVSAPAIDAQKPMPSIYMTVLQQLETRAHVAVPTVIDTKPERAQIGEAEIQGLGPSRRIVIPYSLIAGSTLAELRFIFAREVGQLAANDPVRVAGYNALLVIFGIALAVFIADRIRFRRDDDPVARLALVAALIACVYIIEAPIDNSILRGFSWSADRYALAATGDRDAAVRAIVRQTDQRLDEVCPSVGTRLFLESDPSPAERIAAINHVPPGCP